MVKEVRLSDNRVIFKAKAEKKKQEEESKILPNTVGTRIMQKFDKTASAITEYPVKGLRGDVNSDFYEFLAMGIIPYIIGSGVFMGLFNLVNNHLVPNSKKIASATGKKMALGVVMYGLGKTIGNDLVTRPIAAATGVDIELPYRNVYYPLPTKPGEAADIYPQHQQRKVYDSREFFRKDLIAKDPAYGVAYYDKIAHKLGLGDDLNDSVTETTPIIQSVVSTTKTAKSLASYAWAGVGVGLAMQDSWKDFFDAFSNRAKYYSKEGDGFFAKLGGKIANFGKNTWHLTGEFGKAFGKSCKTMWTGPKGKEGYMRHAGKGFILAAAALTAYGISNAIYRARHMGKLANKDLMDRNQESTVI